MKKSSNPKPGEVKADPAVELNSRIVSKMLSAFRPAVADSPLAERYTTEELLDRMSPTLTVSRNELSRLLYQLGYDLVYEGGQWVWLMEEVDKKKM